MKTEKEIVEQISGLNITISAYKNKLKKGIASKMLRDSIRLNVEFMLREKVVLQCVLGNSLDKYKVSKSGKLIEL